MSDEETRLRKIASNVSEEDRLKQLSESAKVRRDIEETLGTDIVDQDKLEQIVEAIWLNVPISQRPFFTAENWQSAIYEHFSGALIKAENHLADTKIDDRTHVAKIKILRHTFAQQVVRAMTVVAEKYRQRDRKV